MRLELYRNNKSIFATKDFVPTDGSPNLVGYNESYVMTIAFCKCGTDGDVCLQVRFNDRNKLGGDETDAG